MPAYPLRRCSGSANIKPNPLDFDEHLHPLIFGEPTPDARRLLHSQSMLAALLQNRARRADGLGPVFPPRPHRRTLRPGGEEELALLCATGGLVLPGP